MSSTGQQDQKDERTRGRIDRLHPIGGEMSDIVKGLFIRTRIPWLLDHHANVVVLAAASA